MPRLHQTLLVAGEAITAAELLLAGETPVAETEMEFEAVFNNGYTLIVMVTAAAPPQLLAELYNQLGEPIDSVIASGHVDQDYNLSEGDTNYEVTIVRAANTTLTPAAVTAYEANPNRCPACYSEDIYAGPPQVDGNTAWVRVECCACSARWKDLYNFTGISTDPEDWNPPEQNVARHA